MEHSSDWYDPQTSPNPIPSLKSIICQKANTKIMTPACSYDNTLTTINFTCRSQAPSHYVQHLWPTAHWYSMEMCQVLRL